MAAVHAGPHGTVHPMAWSEPRSPTQISSPSNQLPLNGEAARRGSALLRVEATAQSADSAPQSHHKRANGTHPTSTPGTECASHGLPPLRTCGLKYQQHLRAPAGLRVPRGSAPITSSGAHSTVPHGSPHRHGAESSWAGRPASTRRVRRCSHSHLLSLGLAILSASWPKLSACSKTYLPRGLSSTLQTPVTTDTTTPPRLQLKTAQPACQARCCVGHQPLNTQVT